MTVSTKKRFFIDDFPLSSFQQRQNMFEVHVSNASETHATWQRILTNLDNPTYDNDFRCFDGID